MRLLRVLSAFASTPWALELGRLQALAQLLERADAEAEVQAFAEARSDRPSSGGTGAKQNVAVIPVYGVIAHRAHMVQDICGPGGTSTEMLTAAINAAVDDPTVRSIVLDVDSPGGSVFGVQEVADAIYQAREKKPIAAVANATAASAAYWIASAAHEIFVTPSGMVGSIGVFGQHVDTSAADKAAGKVVTTISAGKYKTEGVGPLTDDARDAHAVDDRRLLHAVREGRRAKPWRLRRDRAQRLRPRPHANRRAREGRRHGRRHRDPRRRHPEIRPAHRRDRERADQGARRGPDSNRRRCRADALARPNASSPPKRTPR
jgi:hypothetical protein